jgi:DNA-binding LacI/PurR family transcriptional regulator
MADQVTSRDIAARAGVSQATVSRALRNSPLVRPETRERIHRIARELNYFVNRNAASLRTHHSNTIALLLFDETGDERFEINPFFLSMLGSITREASKLGYDVLVSFQQLSDDWHLEYEVSNRADGIILLGYGAYHTYREKLDALVAADTRFMLWGPLVEDQPGHFLCCDNISGGYQATLHLAGLGRKNIAFLGHASAEVSPEHEQRYRGYVKALTEAGLKHDPDMQVPCDSHECFGYEATEKLLHAGKPVDAIFAVTDAVALGALQALKKRGLRVPEDVALVGFDDLPIASHVTPRLTTVRQDVRQAGKLLVSKLVSLIENESVQSELIPPRLIVRESCGGDPTLPEPF